MRIGILTFYREINFGANIQALSTYGYLLKHGHKPIFIYYYTKEKEAKWGPLMESKPQPRCHREFIDDAIKDQTEVCRNADELNNIIGKYNIESIIVGSDAVLQHHPLRDRLQFSKRTLIHVTKVYPDITFPNPYWGVGVDLKVKMALMSASSQDSEYYHYSEKLKADMRKALSRFTYISVRDSWTRQMIEDITLNSIKAKITPDPVFNFNANAGEYILEREQIINKFGLPEKYVLISLFGQHLSASQLSNLKNSFAQKGISCVAFPMQLGLLFKHPFNYEIPVPLSPVDWYALIKYSSGYIGNNMHPIVVALHNSVPCFSLDFYGTKDFWGRPRKEVTSKVYHIMDSFGIRNNYRRVVKGKTKVEAEEIVESILNFPVQEIEKKAAAKSVEYCNMMEDILKSIK